MLNYNGHEDTIECVDSIFNKSDIKDYQVIIVDNGSTDGSVEKIKAWVENNNINANKLFILENGSNEGYARGNNLGIRFALQNFSNEYILILNNDTILENGFIQPLLEVFKNEKVALASPKIIDPNKNVHWQAFLLKRLNLLTYVIFYSPLRQIFINTPISVEYIISKRNDPLKVYSIQGCSMLFKAKVLEEIGLFDEATFLGWEECIIAEKLLRHGYETYVVPKSKIFHKDSMTHPKVFTSSERRKIYYESETYYQKNYLKLPEYQLWLINVIRRALNCAGTMYNSVRPIK